MRVCLEKQHGEPLQTHAWRGWNKHKHRLNWPQSASVAVSEPHRGRVQCNSSKH